MGHNQSAEITRSLNLISQCRNYEAQTKLKNYFLFYPAKNNNFIIICQVQYFFYLINILYFVTVLDICASEAVERY